MILVATLLVYRTAAASFLSYPTGRHLNAGQYVFGNAGSSLLETLRLSDRSLFLFLSPAPVTNNLIRHQYGDPHYISASSLMDADGDLRAEGSSHNHIHHAPRPCGKSYAAATTPGLAIGMSLAKTSQLHLRATHWTYVLQRFTHSEPSRSVRIIFTSHYRPSSLSNTRLDPCHQNLSTNN